MFVAEAGFDPLPSPDLLRQLTAQHQHPTSEEDRKTKISHVQIGTLKSGRKGEKIKTSSSSLSVTRSAPARILFPFPHVFQFLRCPAQIFPSAKDAAPSFPWELERMDGHHRKREGNKNKRRNAIWEQKGGKSRVYCPARAYISASSLRRRWSRKRRKKKKKAPLFSILLSLVLPLPRRNTSSLPRKQK